jgi:hypothetical protein
MYQVTVTQHPINYVFNFRGISEALDRKKSGPLLIMRARLKRWNQSLYPFIILEVQINYQKFLNWKQTRFAGNFIYCNECIMRNEQN